MLELALTRQTDIKCMYGQKTEVYVLNTVRIVVVEPNMNEKFIHLFISSYYIVFIAKVDI